MEHNKSSVAKILKVIFEADNDKVCDYNIIRDGCDHKKKAFVLANKAKKKYNYGHAKAKKVAIKI